MQKTNVKRGTPHPPGATVTETGVNFSIFSQDATDVQLLLFNKPNDLEPFQVIDLDPVNHCTFFFWHVFVENAKAGMGYAYRMGGTLEPSKGLQFCKNKVLIDPYSKGLANKLWNRDNASNYEDNLHTSMRSIIIDYGNFNWEDDQSPNIPLEESIIYELHIGGFTNDSSSNVKNPGTFLGLIEKIPYLKELGINTVELLPVFEFDETEVSGFDSKGNKLSNYWGYSTIGFFTPHSLFCVNPDDGEHLNEFRQMVKACHKAGIEIILDVVFNHSGEGNHEGPHVHFRGIDNKIYYFLSDESPELYKNYSGCGNTINCNHPIVEKFITDCLEFWVKEMHVDGFRFDEGSILSRGEDGNPMRHPPVIWEIELSETFANIKLIAEAWDAAGLYQIGNFPGYRWSEWNGMFRDDVRRFVKGNAGFQSAVATRITGSFDLYNHDRHSPSNSINFITCHDGFTIMDLVSYNTKHNEDNGESNRDGIDENFSWNCGIEGKTNNQEIIAFRKKQIKNFFAILLLSRGVPMISMGDEAGRTQNGNNNAYCQNNSISWFNWNDLKVNKEIFQFVKKMIKFRTENRCLYHNEFYKGVADHSGFKDIEWHGCKLFSPGWDDIHSKILAFTIGGIGGYSYNIHVMMNFDNIPLSFEIPSPVKDKNWVLFTDTSMDDSMTSKELVIDKNEYQVNPYSIAILKSSK